MEAYQRLEKEFAEFVEAPYAVSCSSGTSALHLALLALGVGVGDEVVVPDFTMAACGFAVAYVGATPIFADVDSNTYSLRPDELKRVIGPKTKAIIIAHIYGRLAPMQELLKIAHEHNIPVIEDACEVHGAIRNSAADITVYSFYRNKIISAEEGGMLVSRNKRFIERAQYLKNMAFDADHSYFHAEIGYNYRLSNAMAEQALASLHSYQENNSKRRNIESWYQAFFPMPKREAVWFYETRVPVKAKREILSAISAARNSFRPLSSLPMWGNTPGHKIARELSSTLILLPAHPSLSREEVEEIASKVKGVCAKYLD